ncbi:MAG: P-loop NTPase [Candidatus Margulisbacteria bacterium]|jgi:MinD-like ATPase involved in chromosome partitioning or flagellar assembly|nr:P-loop NTPase [Candidatus Margulisiibacteriota bacterium]
MFRKNITFSDKTAQNAADILSGRKLLREICALPQSGLKNSDTAWAEIMTEWKKIEKEIYAILRNYPDKLAAELMQEWTIEWKFLAAELKAIKNNPESSTAEIKKEAKNKILNHIHTMLSTALRMQEGRLCEEAARELLAPVLDTPELLRIKPKVFIVGGGKGGVGKSLVTAYLALEAAELDRSVLLLDFDLSRPKLQQQLTGQCGSRGEIYDFVRNGKKHRIYTMLGGTSEEQAIVNNKNNKLYEFVREFFRPGSKSLQMLDSYELILIDVGAGITMAQTVLNMLFNQALIVTTPEPTAFLDAYRYLGTLAAQNTRNPPEFYFVFNDLGDGNPALLKNNLNVLLARNILPHRPKIQLQYAASIPTNKRLAVMPYLKSPRPAVTDLTDLARLVVLQSAGLGKLPLNPAEAINPDRDE